MRHRHISWVRLQINRKKKSKKDVKHIMREFTQSEISEIREMYRSAKNQKAQIGILAQLYLCEKEDIVRVLQNLGEKLPDMGAGKKMNTDQKKRTVRSYDRAVRDQAVKAVLLEGMTQTAAAERFGVTQTTLSTWVQQAKKKQEEFLAYSPDGQSGKSDKGKTTENRCELEEQRKSLNAMRKLMKILPEELIEQSQIREVERMLDKAEGYLLGISKAKKE